MAVFERAVSCPVLDAAPASGEHVGNQPEVPQ
jgi:hypothetical protein